MKTNNDDLRFSFVLNSRVTLTFCYVKRGLLIINFFFRFNNNESSTSLRHMKGFVEYLILRFTALLDDTLSTRLFTYASDDIRVCITRNILTVVYIYI